MPHLTLRDGDQLYFETHGDGPPMALVSGLGGVMAFWQPHLAAFAGRHRVILHDHRGTGQSTRSRIEYSVDQMADDLLQLLDHLGVEQVDLIGHSTGGAVGQTIALDHPKRLRKLVLSASWTSCDGYFGRLFDLRANMLRFEGSLAYARATSIFGFPAAFLRDHAAMLGMEEEGAAASMTPDIVLARIAAIQRFDRHDELTHILHPTLVFGARDDLITPGYFSEELAHQIPDAQLVMLPEGGHFYPRVHPKVFQDTVLGFLAEP